MAAIYIITPYVGYNLILLRHLCIPFFDGENRQRCRRVCQAHPRGGGCYHEIDLIVDVIKIIEDIGIEYHLSFGTLLSVHRDGKISFCNDDTDLMLHIEGDTLSIYQSWKLRKELQKMVDDVELVLDLYSKFCRIDFEGTSEGQLPCFIDAFPENGRYMNSQYPNMTTDAFFDSVYPLEAIFFDDHLMRVPNNVTSWLLEAYGEDYMIPDRLNRGNCDEEGNEDVSYPKSTNMYEII